MVFFWEKHRLPLIQVVQYHQHMGSEVNLSFVPKKRITSSFSWRIIPFSNLSVGYVFGWGTYTTSAVEQLQNGMILQVQNGLVALDIEIHQAFITIS